MSIEKLLHALWAKTEKTTNRTHPLLFHMIDSGQVAAVMWEKSFTSGVRKDFARFLQTDENSAGRILATWISWHDLGKASPAFQRKFPPAERWLTDLGLTFPTSTSLVPEPHGLVTAWTAEPYLVEAGLTAWPARLVARALGGHHGSWPTNLQYTSHTRKSNLGGPVWEQVRRLLIDQTILVFKMPNTQAFFEKEEDLNIFLTIFSGWVTAADWLSSMQERFPPADPDISLYDYAELSRDQAYSVIHDLGWEGWQPTGKEVDFSSLFPFSPNPVQEAVIKLTENFLPPGLAILEAPTGIGKTEIAFYLADRWLQTREGHGLYIAMPTQATSNQMFQRTCAFLRARYPENLVNIQLAHGQAFLSDNLQEIILNNVGEDLQGGVAAAEWFLPAKRSLLAPFGVGTVDQTFLSVLQTKHFFLRLFGLHNKVVIFDEVHAYDTYMAEIFTRLLGWLRAIGASVIILSATLPEKARQSFIQAYGGQITDQGDIPGYPRLTLVSTSQTSTYPLPITNRRRIALLHLSTSNSVIEFLQKQLRDGGCAAVICNTVKRAQDMAEIIRAAKIVDSEEVILFHARFPFQWRNEIERSILERFGKDGKRPNRSIVVATQVIEQSLDLDFDVIVSEIAPIDLIIQRAGRLHRHNRDDRRSSIAQPVFALIMPDMKDGSPNFGSNKYVYEEYLLLRSYVILERKTQLYIPDDTQELIEGAYGDKALENITIEMQSRINKAYHEMVQDRQSSISHARQRLVLPASDEELLTRQNLNLEEDNEQINKDLQALTREGDPGVNLICLFRHQDSRLYLDPEIEDTPISLDIPPTKATIKNLLANSLKLQTPHSVVLHLSSLTVPEPWSEVAALRHHHPIIFEHHRSLIQKLSVSLVLTREMGLFVEQEAI